MLPFIGKVAAHDKVVKPLLAEAGFACQLVLVARIPARKEPPR